MRLHGLPRRNVVSRDIATANISRDIGAQGQASKLSEEQQVAGCQEAKVVEAKVFRARHDAE